MGETHKMIMGIIGTVAAGAAATSNGGGACTDDNDGDGDGDDVRQARLVVRRVELLNEISALNNKAESMIIDTYMETRK